jgi:glycosyltransferase involved in cell wall biosynthesis
MKIAFISQPWNDAEPPVESGSIAIWIYQVSRRLAHDHDISIYARRPASQTKLKYVDGIRYQFVSIFLDYWMLRILKILRNKIFKRFPGWSNPNHPIFSSWRYYFGYALQIALDMRRSRYDVVHIQNLSQFVPIIRAFNPGVKIVLHMHCEWLSQLDEDIISRRLRKTDLILACSEYITRKIRGRFPQYQNRCNTIYNGVDVKKFYNENVSDNNNKRYNQRLLFVGRISPEKGLHILLDAYKKVIEYFPQTLLEFIGPKSASPLEFIFKLSDDPKVSNLSSFCNGFYIDYLKAQIPTTLKDQVIFTGTVPHSDLNQYYCNASVYVQPSFTEAFPFPIVEAMSSSMAVVATRVGGIPEALENSKTGLLVDPGDVDKLAEAILRLLKDKKLRENMSKEARKRAIERFSWEMICNKLVLFYDNINRI